MRLLRRWIGLSSLFALTVLLVGLTLAGRGARAAGEQNVLQVHNQTPFILTIYLGDLKLGWVRPFRTGRIRGLVTGYHKLYAHSEFGTVSFGPRETWVPGNWNIVY